MLTRGKQRAVAHETAKERLKIMGLDPELVSGGEALHALDELYYTQPQSVAYQWWHTATEQEGRIFLQEWDRWQQQDKDRCAFCRGTLDPAITAHSVVVLCQECARLLHGAPVG